MDSDGGHRGGIGFPLGYITRIYKRGYSSSCLGGWYLGYLGSWDFLNMLALGLGVWSLSLEFEFGV